MSLRPPVPYFGGKMTIGPQIAALLPAHGHYVEPYCGSLERLQHVSLEARPALDIIARYGQHPDVLLYVDPPYLGSTRTRSWDGYEHEMRSEADHRALAEALHAARAAVVLSGYASDLYDRELYAGWDRHTMAAGTGQGEGWGNRTEVLWSNRPLATAQALFDVPVDGSVP